MTENTVPAALRLASDTLEDLEALRVATGNRHGFATRDEADSDGAFRGLGLDERHPMVALAGATLAALEAAEQDLILGLQREVRKTVFADWIKNQKGAGEKTIARLLGAIGDPYINEETGQPRSLRQLWAYAGYAVDGGSARRAKKGMTQKELLALGKPVAKKRAYLVAESCVKSGIRRREGAGNDFTPESREATTPFASVYYNRRVDTLGREHSAACTRCGPTGKPAQPGSPWSPGHQHADALRVVAKEILRDLWLIAREHHSHI